ncbi:hypothetical protein O9G_000114 [Rozella allomycis CSF55]|uniref:Uncharacterized protein n=1 Tax=Rozella allomycis (strain CSF55) TaxID=988480 RepID=A0A075ANV1_ROZAC|nr:hypothetical protein O9G_000114 [Rozella allomycis CSF55]|eukprot:EPZ31635.1 hypothetical protein O9G_000114 [Rozella allomycis CSF55]
MSESAEDYAFADFLLYKIIEDNLNNTNSPERDTYLYLVNKLDDNIKARYLVTKVLEVLLHCEDDSKGEDVRAEALKEILNVVEKAFKYWKSKTMVILHLLMEIRTQLEENCEKYLNTDFIKVDIAHFNTLPSADIQREILERNELVTANLRDTFKYEDFIGNTIKVMRHLNSSLSTPLMLKAVNETKTKPPVLTREERRNLIVKKYMEKHNLRGSIYSYKVEHPSIISDDENPFESCDDDIDKQNLFQSQVLDKDNSDDSETEKVEYHQEDIDDEVGGVSDGDGEDESKKCQISSTDITSSMPLAHTPDQPDMQMKKLPARQKVNPVQIVQIKPSKLEEPETTMEIRATQPKKRLIDRRESAERATFDDSEKEEAVKAVPKKTKMALQPKPSSKKRVPYSKEEEINLIKGMQQFGTQWHLIRDNYEFQNRSNKDLKDKARNMKKSYQLPKDLMELFN